MPQDPQIPGSNQAPIHDREIRHLRALTETLEQLINVQDRAVLQQSDHLELMLRQLQGFNDRLITSQEQIRQQKSTLQSVLDNMSDGVVVVDEQGRFLQFNPAAERIIGAGRMDIDLHDWSEHYALFLPDQRTPYPPQSLPLARAIQGEAVDGAQIYIRRQQELPGIWISVNARPLLREDGTIHGGVAVFRDITEEKKSLALLEQLSAIVEQTDDIVFVTDRLGAISYVNPAFERTTGFSSAEAVGRTPRILKSGEHSPNFYKALWETISTGGVYRDALINRRKNGELFYCEETITPMKDNQGRITHFVSLLKDMTHRRRMLAQEFELKMAAVVQKKLYPEKAPNWPGVDVAGEVFPAEATCGDYFDYFLIQDNTYGLAIGDVSGHGLGPALVMAEARAYLRCLATTIRGLGNLFTRLNQVLLADLEDERFLALMVLSLDPDKGRLCYANAGHLPGYVLSDSGAVKAKLKATGPPLGILPDPIYEPSQSIFMQPGDLVFMVTDGITESTSPDNSFFNMEGVLHVVREMQDCPAQQIIRGVYQAASAFSHNQPQQDDMSMVVLKFQPGGESGLTPGQS